MAVQYVVSEECVQRDENPIRTNDLFSTDHKVIYDHRWTVFPLVASIHCVDVYGPADCQNVAPVVVGKLAMQIRTQIPD